MVNTRFQCREVLLLLCSYNSHAIEAILLAEDLKDKKKSEAGGEKKKRVRASSSSSDGKSHSMQIKCSKSVNQNSCHFNKHSNEQSDD